MENDEENKDLDIEIVDGSGDLEISPVYTHVNMNKKPTDDNDNKKNIVIPEEKK